MKTFESIKQQMQSSVQRWLNYSTHLDLGSASAFFGPAVQTLTRHRLQFIFNQVLNLFLSLSSYFFTLQSRLKRNAPKRGSSTCWTQALHFAVSETCGRHNGTRKEMLVDANLLRSQKILLQSTKKVPPTHHIKKKEEKSQKETNAWGSNDLFLSPRSGWRNR